MAECWTTRDYLIEAYANLAMAHAAVSAGAAAYERLHYSIRNRHRVHLRLGQWKIRSLADEQPRLGLPLV
jgi:hypothetical protein